MRTRSRPLITKLGLVAILVGTIFATTAAFHLEDDLWIALLSVAVVGVGILLVSIACRQALFLWVLIERIVVVVALGALIPVTGLTMYSAAQSESWFWRAAVFVAFGLVIVWIVGRVPINIDSWFKGPFPAPPDKSLERTREG